MNTVNELNKRLADMQATINVFPGTEPVTPERLAREVLNVLDQLAAGDFEEVEFD